MNIKKTAVVNFQQLSINSIDTSSGVFIGQIQANGWYNSKKDNFGFGTVSNSKIKDTVQIVIDNDNIDMPINNYKYNLYDKGLKDKDGQINNAYDKEEGYSQKDEESLQQDIQFNDININDSSTNAAVTIGRSLLDGWHSQTKNNYGLGRFIGEIYAEYLAGNVNDQDLLDAATYTHNINSPDTSFRRKIDS
ncbi:hypothetical protein [Scopulibacillus cellulosilyticus]|uniref:Uncharacterized protein n=1 Tax=Scopulibacillus cellulosilyticus TaxID=2665665 RepID=A0ABW2PR17_9BACL